MQINFKDKKAYIWIIVVIVLVIILYLLIANKKPATNEVSECESATKIATEAATAWGNTDDMRSEDYQTKLGSYLTGDMKKSFEQEWSTLDPLEQVNSKLVIQGVTCKSDANQTVVTIDAKKSDNASGLIPVELTIELVNTNDQYLVNGFADNYEKNVKIY